MTGIVPWCSRAGTGAADAGSGDGGVTQTVGDQCSTIATAFCEHVTSDCIWPDTLADCVTSEMLTCCTGGACDSPSATSPVTVSSCASAIAVQECNLAVNMGVHGLPVCQGIPRPR